MGLALRSFDFYDLYQDEEQKPRPPKPSSYFLPVDNVDASEPAPFSDAVYSESSTQGKLSIMSAFRKDLFVSVTLPLLALGVIAFGAIGASFSYTNSSFLRLDDHGRQNQASIADLVRAQAVTTEQISSLVKGQQDANTKLDTSNSKLDKISDQLGSLNTALEVLKAGKKQNPES